MHDACTSNSYFCIDFCKHVACIIPPAIVGVGFTHAQAHPNNFATTFTGML